MTQLELTLEVPKRGRPRKPDALTSAQRQKRFRDKNSLTPKQISVVCGWWHNSKTSDDWLRTADMLMGAAAMLHGEAFSDLHEFARLAIWRSITATE